MTLWFRKKAIEGLLDQDKHRPLPTPPPTPGRGRREGKDDSPDTIRGIPDLFWWAGGERPESGKRRRGRYRKSSMGEQMGGKPGERLEKEGPGCNGQEAQTSRVLYQVVPDLCGWCSRPQPLGRVCQASRWHSHVKKVGRCQGEEGIVGRRCRKAG